jgi:hypothetical protein
LWESGHLVQSCIHGIDHPVGVNVFLTSHFFGGMHEDNPSSNNHNKQGGYVQACAVKV